MRGVSYIICLFSLFCLQGLSQAQTKALNYPKTISIVADEWCPINCEPDSTSPGYMIEIVKEIFEKRGFNIEYRTMSWTRALSRVREGEDHLVVGAYPEDASDFIFPEEPLGHTCEVFYINSSSGWSYRDVNSFANIKLGVIRGYSYGPEIDAHIHRYRVNPNMVHALSGDKALERLVHLLSQDRINVLVENEYVMEYFLQSHPQYKSKLKKSSNAYKHRFVYAAFSPSKKESKEYSLILSSGIREMRQSGRLQEILQKYSIDDWK